MDDALTREQGVKICEPQLFCDNCSFYPIEPVHGHFTCPRCHMPTKCCEGISLEITPTEAG